MSAAHAALRSPAALADFVRGEWQLSKTMTYVCGGITSTFTGTATFAPLELTELPGVLAYHEKVHQCASNQMPLLGAKHQPSLLAGRGIDRWEHLPRASTLAVGLRSGSYCGIFR